ncbi:hypothetical protein K4L44_09670 [Halosquirtibacter laminarini]|uniref:Uncharacterized protein n=1 Tax=Halosquirtibacter laminarini TaxID=3374600 RepID=A0AC61NF99_9BACT|nr:hypothetical protein K4L44_09670 [Prolixibacteraceae bacterium]
MAKKIDVQEEMVNEIIEHVAQVMENTVGYQEVAPLIDAIIKITEEKRDEQLIFNTIATHLSLKKDDIRVEQVYTIISLNPLTQTYHPFQNDKLEALKREMES